MITVIKTGGKQYKVKKGDIIKIEKSPGKVGEKIIFDKVLLIGEEDGKKLEIGKPYLSNIRVEGEILEQGKDKKIKVVKFKRKTRYHRKKSHRQLYTKVKIKKILV